ncbi:MAG: hypothetical protein HYY06_09735 [Deltaproteobacteria bacterium]|nr:hypothetical protein [Deltaproteobacteria bacterium]
MRTIGRLQMLSMLLAGFLAGIALVVACGRGRGGGGAGDASDDAGFEAGRDAEAQEEGSCSQWAVIALEWDDLEASGWISDTSAYVGPDGWEPFAFKDSGRPTWVFRRCVR